MPDPTPARLSEPPPATPSAPTLFRCGADGHPPLPVPADTPEEAAATYRRWAGLPAGHPVTAAPDGGGGGS